MIKQGTQTVKLIAGKYLVPVAITRTGDQLTFRFGYNKRLIEEIRSLDGRKWNPDQKCWTAPYTRRNQFSLAYLMGENPYARYESEIVSIPTTRDLYAHQRVMLDFWIAKQRATVAAGMGTGKSLIMLEGAEYLWNLYKPAGMSTMEAIWYVGPKSALVSFKREMEKWNARFIPQLFTCEGMVKHVANISQRPSAIPPLILLLDESSKYKTCTSQRSKAAKHIADEMAEYWAPRLGGCEGFIVEATGTPAPKDPTDWWHQIEILCPGYLKEPNVHVMRQTLGIIEQRESQYGANYPHLVAWLDDEKKCGVCGQYADHMNHDPSDLLLGVKSAHSYRPSVNEVDRLYHRLKDIVLVIDKSKCLDLPEKQYELIKVKPTVEMLRSAQNIKAVSRRAIEALTLLRELSDGFQYDSIDSDKREICKICGGTGNITEHIPTEERDPNDFTIDLNTEYTVETIKCPDCMGVGDMPVKIRVADEVKSPKDQVFLDELEAHEEIGRYVVWGGFTGTIDRLVKMALLKDWSVIRVDGRGYVAMLANDKLPTADYSTLLDAMDLSNSRYKALQAMYPRVCFVGHPRAGGMGLTLTASPTALFFSNDFSGEARMQAEDRIHRLGMDSNRGATIKDILMLPTDKLVIDNLKKKKSLQAISMGDLNGSGNDNA